MNSKIELEIERIKNKIIESYEILAELGASIPQNQNSYNLVETIKSLSPEELMEFVTKNNDTLVNTMGEQVTNEMIHDLDTINTLTGQDLLIAENNTDTMNLNLDTLTDYVAD